MADTSFDVVSYILYSAINTRSSDIHIEPDAMNLHVRFRIDGILHPFKTFEANLRDTIISKVKILAHMNITEKRLPEDGHIEYRYGNVIYNVRVSSLPTMYGEALVLRVLNRAGASLDLTKLGLEQQQLALLMKMIEAPSGMILISGPTGSGKTNLLYSILNYLNKPEKNIMTLEDPIEFQMQGVRQTQINESIGYTFAKAMRAVVRQDPNVIMLGEIRDEETVQMSVQAALIGILVLSTFHTFDVPALVSRLTEMGTTPTIVAQALQGVVSSRLVRQICPACKGAYKPDASLLQVLGQNAMLQKGKGCANCKNTGYFGRIGVYEVIRFDDEIRSAIIERKPSLFVIELIKKKQFMSLKEAAVKKVLASITTFEEAQRIVGGLI